MWTVGKRRTGWRRGPWGPARNDPTANLSYVIALLMVCLAACSIPLDPTLPPLRVGSSGDYAPFSLQSAEGVSEGLDIDVARRFARDTGRRLEIVPFRWSDLTTALAANAFDIAMSGVTMRPERALVGTFTRPIATSGAVALVRRGFAEVAENLDRQGVRLAVNRGGHLERTTRRLFPLADITTVDDNLALPLQLEKGDVDAIICDQYEAARWRPLMRPTPIVIGPFTVDHKAYLAREPGVAAELDTWMRAREADGTLTDLRRTWLGAEGAGERSAFESDVDALLALIDLRLAFMPSVAAAKLAAGRPVVDPEQEEQVLARAREDARALGLEVRSAVELFSALIAAARTIQTDYAALPVARRPFIEAADLARTLRPAIGDVSRALLRRAADVTREPTALSALPVGGLARLLDPSLTLSADRDRLAAAVHGLRPAADRSDRPADR